MYTVCAASAGWPELAPVVSRVGKGENSQVSDTRESICLRCQFWLLPKEREKGERREERCGVPECVSRLVMPGSHASSLPPLREMPQKQIGSPFSTRSYK